VALPPDPEAFIEQVLGDEERYLNGSLARLMRFMGLDTVEWEGQGAILRDVRGKEYVDCSGYGVLFHGHSHPRVVRAVQEQAARLAISSRMLPHAPAATLARMLGEATPGDLQYTFFCNSGTEAVEGAVKLARARTRRPGIVAAEGGFHGKTLGALGLNGAAFYREPFEPLLPGIRRVPYGDAAALAAAVDETVAAVVLEPIQGEAGVIIPPDGYLAAAREACDRAGAMLILDEVQTGIGRTGTLFCCEQSGVVPDILCMAKSLGGGVMPIGAFTARPDVWQPFDENPFLHTSTFGGNPLACAAGIAALEAIREEGLLEKARLRGGELLAGLQAIAADYPEVVPEVRGRGLLIGLDLANQAVGGVFMAELLDRGVIPTISLNKLHVVRLLPPAVISAEQVGRVIEAVGQAVAAAAAMAGQLGAE
jgi:putrescine aminotransferase